ncbi:uncharacterized protein LAESUDRAFT_759040 [Laetiporus sulphureus 93-53]|uniref:Conidiation protein 6 n=1 Tax=Laetiporus sulphureus 93-53 TaxID=1314785 RepID=A0A165EEE3_9APHY|nr:uncharacterized protein LAESUDRAFT_759040 [Laetiporus sulphureus 93-53]KZT06870.1 hypothetical protein LAESUDRAFT_759040 [Laetiporus sulphureus 93-53]
MSSPVNIARGLKAAISNPHNSEEAKEHASERLQEVQESGDFSLSEAHEANVATGHKAALSNPNVSDDAKKYSAKVLKDMESS